MNIPNSTLAVDAGASDHGGDSAGDEKYFRLAMDVAQKFKPLERHEEQALLSRGKGLEPISHLGNDV